MAEEEESFHLIFKKFLNDFPIKRDVKCLTSRKKGYVLFYEKNEQIGVGCLDSGSILMLNESSSSVSDSETQIRTPSHNQHDQTWSRPSGICWSHDGRCFITLNKDETISISKLEKEERKIACHDVVKCCLSTLREVTQHYYQDLKLSPSLIILYLRGNRVILYHHEHVLKIDLYSGHLPRVLACFKVGCVAKDIPKAVQLINDDNILAHLNQQAILSFWDLEKQVEMSHIDFTVILSSPAHAILESIEDLIIADYSTHVCLLRKTHSIVVIKLKEYFKQYPCHISKDSQHSDTQYGNINLNAVTVDKSTHKNLWTSAFSVLDSQEESHSHQKYFSPPDVYSRKVMDSEPLDASDTSQRAECQKNDTLSGFKQTSIYWSADLPSLVNVMSFQQSSLDCRTLYFWYSHSTPIDQRSALFTSKGIIFAIDLVEPKVSYHRLTEDSIVLLSTGSCPLIVTEDSLYGVSFGLPQEEIISKLMLYESAGVADTLCHNNQWQRCTVPLHALEAGLQHRQLDTVAFFLKSRENIFASEAGSNQGSSPVDGAVQDLHYSDLDLQQVEAAVTLLSVTIRKNIAERGPSQQFAEQLLNITLGYLHKLTRNIVSKLQQAKVAETATLDFEGQTEALLTRLTDHVMELRSYLLHPSMKQTFKDPEPLKTPVDKLVFSREQKDIVKLWKSLDEKAAIVEGILSGEVPLLQSYLRSTGHAEKADLSRIIDIGLQEALAFLLEKDMTYAVKIFNNLGFDVVTKLRQVCLYTPEVGLRSYLARELQKQGQLTKEEEDMIAFIEKLQSLYSCPSFDLAVLLRTESVENDWETRTDLSATLSSSQNFDMKSHLGDIAHVDVVNSETAYYAHVLLDWVRRWDVDTRNRILLDPVMCKKDSSLRQTHGAKIVWEYMCRHLDLKRLIEWTNVQYPSVDNTDIPVSSTWPYSQPITSDMLQILKEKTTDYVKNEVLDTLAGNGILCQSEAGNMQKVLRRLSRIQRVMQNPHPLQNMLENVDVNIDDLHTYIISWCIEHDMHQFLYFYLDYWSLCMENPDLAQQVAGLSQVDIPSWVDMLLHFRITGLRNTAESIFQASLSSSQFLQSTTNSSIQTMLEEGLIGRALASLVYSPHQLQQIINNPPCQIKEALQPFPRLHQALFDSNRDDSLPRQDITMYHLLQDTASIDIRGLFGWQSSNTLATEESNAVKELPHFSSSALVEEYAYSESLKYWYYLKQGRPTFAFCAFLVEQWKQGAKILTSKRIKSACLRAHWLSMKLFDQSSATSACAAFTELLGQDSTLLRLHVEVANLIYNHKCVISEAPHSKQQSSKFSLHAKIVNLLEGCLRHHKPCAVEVSELLQDSISWKLNQQSCRRSSFEASQSWLSSVMLSVSHQIPLPTGFLRVCALEDDWFMFLMFAQMHQYPPEQLKTLLSDFRSPHLREHLYHVLNNLKIEGSGDDGSSEEPDLSLPQEQAKQIRAQLYARIGLSTDNRETSSSSEEDDEYESAPEEPEDLNNETFTSAPENDSNNMEIDLTHLTDVLSVTLACHDTSFPWRSLCSCGIRCNNPVFTVIATCYEGSDIIHCLTCWLIASTPKHSSSTPVTPSGTDLFCLSDLHDIVDKLLENSCMPIFEECLKIFDPECVLIDFLEFYTALLSHSENQDCHELLHAFKTRFQNQLESTAKETNNLFPLTWIVKCTKSMVTYLLDHCVQPQIVKIFLQLVDQEGIGKMLELDVDFSQLLQMHQVVAESGLKLPYSVLARPHEDAFKQSCLQILGDLENRELYTQARLFAQVAGLDASLITICQLKNELGGFEGSRAWEQPEMRQHFWKHCQDLLTKHKVDPSIAAHFFKERADISSCPAEQSYLYKLAYDCLVKNHGSDESEDTGKQSDVFTLLWKSRIQEYIHQQQQTEELTVDSQLVSWEGGCTRPQLHGRQLLCCHLPSAIEKTGLLTAEEQTILDVLMGELLENGELSEACQLAKHFGYYSEDLIIISSCLKLALGEIVPGDLTSSLKQLLSLPRVQRNRSYSHTFISLPRSGSVRSLSSRVAQRLDQEEDEEEDTILSVLQSLGQHCSSGQTCCQLINTAYKLAEVLSLDVKSVLTQEPYPLLHSLLSTSHHHRYTMAKAFITVLRLPDSEVAGFLSDTILETLQYYADDGPERRKQQVMSSPWETSNGVAGGVEELLQLCGKPAALGQRLLDTASSLISSESEATNKVLMIEVELLIYSHDCHTLDCHMEGVSAVLRSARSLTTLLNQTHQLALMVRLLTGIGRFGEMTYIFDLLKQQHQFELLFRKGIDKEDRLRLAILDYLQHYHPEDVEAHSMVALRFTMFRQIAGMVEQMAHKQLSLLKNRPLENNAETQLILQTTLNYYSNAANSYVKENCLHHAECCVRNARLVALQVHLLPSNTRVIHLDKESLHRFVMHHSQFSEAYIVCEAYGEHSFWAEAILVFVIHNADFTYLQDVKCHVGLSTSIVAEVVDRFRGVGHPTKAALSNMKRLLGQMTDVRQAYRLACQLGLHEMARDMLQGQNGAYLRDTCSTMTSEQTMSFK